MTGGLLRRALTGRGGRLTFDTESRHTLVDGIQGILCEMKLRSARSSRAGEAGASDGVVKTTRRWRRRTNLHQLSAVGEVSYRIVELLVDENVSLPGGEGGQREGVSVCHGCCWSRTPRERILRCGSAAGGVDAAGGDVLVAVVVVVWEEGGGGNWVEGEAVAVPTSMYLR